MGYELAWLNPHERYVYECGERSCFYSVDVFCEMPGRNVPTEGERVDLYKGWSVVFFRFELEGVGTCEAEVLLSEREGEAQLINLKLWTARRLEPTEIEAVRRRVCESLGGTGVTFNSTASGG